MALNGFPSMKVIHTSSKVSTESFDMWTAIVAMITVAYTNVRLSKGCDTCAVFVRSAVLQQRFHQALQ